MRYPKVQFIADVKFYGSLFLVILACLFVIPGLAFGLFLTIKDGLESRRYHSGMTAEGPTMILLSLVSLAFILLGVL